MGLWFRVPQPQTRALEGGSDFGARAWGVRARVSRAPMNAIKVHEPKHEGETAELEANNGKSYPKP